MTVPLLQVRNLRVTFQPKGLASRRRRAVQAVRGISFDIERGEAFGLVGESGSGKSTTARGILRLVDAEGEVRLEGEDVLGADRRRLRELRPRMQMVFQDPYSSIDPSRRIVDIVGEPLRVHTGLNRREREAKVVDLLAQVGLAGHYIHRYPHEFSGGQRQRIAIARAIALNPSLAVCDEAVSALDVSTQNQVINLLEELRTSHDVAYLFITHNLAVVHHIADRIGVMYLGRLVEVADAARVFSAPAHPYTRSLLAAMPIARAGGRRRDGGAVVAGELPDPSAPPSGCAFHPRCPAAMDVCLHEDPAPRVAPGGGEVACHLYDEQPVAVDVGRRRGST